MAGSMQRSNDRIVQDILPSRHQQRHNSLLATSALNGNMPGNSSGNNQANLHYEPGYQDPSRLTRKLSHRQVQQQPQGGQMGASPLHHPKQDGHGLSRKGSFHNNGNNNKLSIDEEMKLRRKSSFRNHSTHQQQHPSKQSDGSGLTRKSSHHNNMNGNNNRANNGKLTRQMSLRNEHVNYHHNRSSSEVEKEDRRRRRNRESARRARERERSERELMERAYDANEERIKHLENIVDELSSELRRHNTISTIRSPPRNAHNNSKNNKHFDQGDERPSWFGAAF